MDSNKAPTRCIWIVSQELLKYLRQDGALYVSGQLRVVAEAVNLGDHPHVGLRYTLDHWKTWKEIEGVWSKHIHETSTDQFLICSESTIPPGASLQYALYSKANNTTYWDNNHSQNFTAQF